MPLCIHRLLFKDWKPKPPTVIISRYGDSLVANEGSSTATLLSGCQTPLKAVFQVTDTRGYLILGHEKVQQIGYMHFPKITPSKLKQQPKTHAYLKTKAPKASRHKKTSRRGQDLKCSRVQMLDGAVLINGERHNLPITYVYILEECHNAFNGIWTLPGDEYQITLNKLHISPTTPLKIGTSRAQFRI